MRELMILLLVVATMVCLHRMTDTKVGDEIETLIF